MSNFEVHIVSNTYGLCGSQETMVAVFLSQIQLSDLVLGLGPDSVKYPLDLTELCFLTPFFRVNPEIFHTCTIGHYSYATSGNLGFFDFCSPDI